MTAPLWRRCGSVNGTRSELSAMGGTNDKSEAYPFGYTQAEARRLAEHAGLFEDLTEDVMRRAGLCPGQSVLDIGCGVGDVSLLVARMVGAEGRVLGLDRAASSIETAPLPQGG